MGNGGRGRVGVLVGLNGGRVGFAGGVERWG